jgi:hypothetical protein
MSSWVLRRLILVAVIMSTPATGYAQDATLSGAVTDTTGGVLPGVTVTALLEASGNTFVAVSDERGAYRLPVRIGVYRITAELAGFATVAKTMEVLVGQQAIMNFQMAPSGVQESVTVSGEAPLIQRTSSTLGGNIDSRQMQALPVNGRNFMDLAMLAPGNRTNAVTENAPVTPSSKFNEGTFQLNIDGQQVTNLLTGAGGFGEPRYSRDAIAEFVFVANRFDATQGRSLGVQLNAITKSGTNLFAGTFGGYFRNSAWPGNAADFIQHRVLTYSNQQLSTTFGGPIVKDKIHFFANYEYEREPQTYTYSSIYPQFNIDQGGIHREKPMGLRLDFQFSSNTHLSFRGNLWSNLLPYDPRYTGGANKHPSGALTTNYHMKQLFTDLTHVVSNRAVNDLKLGYAGFSWYTNPVVRLANGQGPVSILFGSGYNIGLNYTLSPQTLNQSTPSVRDDFSYSFTKGGRHDVRVGGEFLGNFWDISWLSNYGGGQIIASGGAVPANLQSLFPVWNDPSTWNLAALSPITVSYSQAVGNPTFRNPWHIYAGWWQDDWAVNNRLTLNLGVRYDLMLGEFAERSAVNIQPFFTLGSRHAQKDMLAPRLGAVYTLNDRTALRGGFGKFFTQPPNSFNHFILPENQQVFYTVFNDGRPDFAANPFNGPAPTYEQAIANVCDINPTPNCFHRNLGMWTLPSAQTPYSYQTTFGLQRQFGNLGATVDYVYTASRHDPYQQNINLSYNPATGANYPFTDISTRPYPGWGTVQPWYTEGYSNYHALQTAVTKRFSQRWQASGTYTLSRYKDGTPQPTDLFKNGCQYPTSRAAGGGFVCDVPVTVATDLGGSHGLGLGDQRQRASANGVWEVGRGVEVSGVYFYGSGVRQVTTWGTDLRSTGNTGENRLRPDGTIVPRNNLVGLPIHRVDLRLLRQFKFGGTKLDGIVEMFNVFNHANYGAYVTNEIAKNYGAPSAVQNIAYNPRQIQLGLHVSF